jgi:hypothetical protein
MASSTTKRSLCKACNKAPSVFLCQGCEKDFCTDHAKEHRQELSKQLDTIIVGHDQLKQNLAQCTSESSLHPLMKKIDQWETESMDTIRMVADDARKQLSNVIGIHTTKITEELKHLTQELTAARSENNFIEIDLKEWMERLEQWTKELSTPSSITIQQEKSDSPFIQKIIVNLKKNEFFDRATEKIKIEDNGQVIIAVSGGYSTARCQGDYSSGQHKFRFKIEQKDSSNWMYFGIVSKNVLLQETSYTTPTNFGWVSNGYAILNVVATSRYTSDVMQNDIIELFLDCDRQMIRLTNERTNNKHELNVNVAECSRPWQLHIGLHYQNDRVRYLPA